jgi:hypothetical protein
MVDDGEGGFKLALCTVIFVQGDKLTSHAAGKLVENP